jgi:L-2-hydroxyglutarate oxidase LhgO
MSPLVLESAARVADGITSRNSGVIHAGIYYPPDSLKAQACVRGNQLIYEWCQANRVPHRQVGKWIVGSSDDEGRVIELLESARRSGAPDVELATKDQIERAGLRGDVGLFSPRTGIVDPIDYTRSLQAAAEADGALFVTRCAVRGIARLAMGGYTLRTTRGDIDSDLVVNSAGLHADEIAAMIGIVGYKVYPNRGDYFLLSDRSAFRQLVYPVKKKTSTGLGIHLTVGLDGSCRLGPDSYYVASKTDLSPPPELEAKRRLFHQAARAYLPSLDLTDLHYDDCGIRPKLRSPEESEEKDFIVREDAAGFINLIGIESPGLTASLDLAQRVAAMIKGNNKA